MAAARALGGIYVTRQYLSKCICHAAGLRQADGRARWFLTSDNDYKAALVMHNIAEVRSSLPSRYVALWSFRRLVPLAFALTGAIWCRRGEGQRGMGVGGMLVR